MALNEKTANSWSVVAASVEVPAGEIVQAFLHGQELALWRNAAGVIQVWANRCPHRGTRFTMGRIVDDQLSCGYHGWRFGSGGQCTYIPAHPKLPPPKTVCAKTFQAVERNGMIWTCLGVPGTDAPQLQGLQQALFCRSFVVYQPADKVMQELAHASGHHYESLEEHVLVGKGDAGATLILLVQPMTEGKSTVYLWANSDQAADGANDIRQRHNALFKQHRQQLEAAA